MAAASCTRPTAMPGRKIFKAAQELPPAPQNNVFYDNSQASRCAASTASSAHCTPFKMMGLRLDKETANARCLV